MKTLNNIATTVNAVCAIVMLFLVVNMYEVISAMKDTTQRAAQEISLMSDARIDMMFAVDDIRRSVRLMAMSPKEPIIERRIIVAQPVEQRPHIIQSENMKLITLARSYALWASHCDYLYPGHGRHNTRKARRVWHRCLATLHKKRRALLAEAKKMPVGIVSSVANTASMAVMGGFIGNIRVDSHANTNSNAAASVNSQSRANAILNQRQCNYIDDKHRDGC